MNEALPIFVSIIIAILGSIGGVAALLKVSAENSNTVADGAKKVVDLMDGRLADSEKRLDSLEAYIEHFDAWADKLLDILDRAITKVPDSLREELVQESNKLKNIRPRRGR